MVTLKNLSLENWFNVVKTEVCLENQGLVLVTGENGAAKSAIFVEAPYYGLFGDSFRYGDNPGTAVIRTGSKGFRNVLDIHADGVGDITIARCKRDPQKVYPDGLSVWQDGVDISRGGPGATQAWLNELYAMGGKTFANSVMFTGDTLRFPLLSDSKKKEVLDDLLRLDSLDKARKVGETARKELGGQVSTYENKLGLMEEQLPDLDEETKEVEGKDKEWSSDHKTRLKTCKGTVAVLVEAVGKASDALKESKDALQTAQTRHASLQNKIVAAREELSELRTAFVKKQSDIDSRISIAAAAVSSLKTQIDGKESLIGNNCPKCGQAVAGEVQEWVDAKKAEMTKASKHLAKVRGESSTLAEDKETLDASTESLNEAGEKLSQRHKTVQKLSNALEEAATTLASKKSLLASEETRFESLTQETNPYGASLESLKARKKALQTKIVESKEALEKAKKDLEIETILDATFGNKGARLHLLEMVIPSLNLEAARVREIIQTPMVVSFNLRGDEQSYAGTFEVNVENPTGASLYRGDSSGERRRVDVILLFSLLRLASTRGAKSFSQAVFDEPFENLDIQGQEAILRLLQMEAKTKSSLFVISHSASEIQSNVSKVWRVQKGGKIEYNA